MNLNGVRKKLCVYILECYSFYMQCTLQINEKWNSKTFCRNQGSNQGPLDLQSNALPTELFRLCRFITQSQTHLSTLILLFSQIPTMTALVPNSFSNTCLKTYLPLVQFTNQTLAFQSSNRRPCSDFGFEKNFALMISFLFPFNHYHRWRRENNCKSKGETAVTFSFIHFMQIFK